MSPSSSRRLRLIALVVIALAIASVALAACGGDDDDDEASDQPATTQTQTTETERQAGEVVAVAADPGGALEFEQESLTAAPGRTTFEFTNESSTQHDFVIEQDGEDIAKTDVISDSTDEVTADLEAGEYAFYCSVAGHRQAGMEGTLTVE